MALVLPRPQHGSRESFCILAGDAGGGTIFLVTISDHVFLIISIGEKILDSSYCLRCNREIVSGQKSVAVYMFAQTVGVRPRQKSTAQRICFCPQCSVSLAMGPPPEGALNMVAWNMIRDVVSSDPALSQAAWESMHNVAGLLPEEEPQAIPRRAAAGGYFEF
jgi:hypothetical protein